MALTYSPTQKGTVISIPTLVLSVLIAAIMLFFLLSSLSTCSCPSSLQSFNDNTMAEMRSTRLIEKKEYQLRKRVLNGLKIRFKLMAYICKTMFFGKGLILVLELNSYKILSSSRAYHVMKSRSQRITLHSHVLASYSWKSTIATMGSPGLVDVMCLSSLLSLATYHPTCVCLRLGAELSVSACILFAISALSTTTVLKEMSSL